MLHLFLQWINTHLVQWLVPWAGCYFQTQDKAQCQCHQVFIDFAQQWSSMEQAVAMRQWFLIESSYWTSRKKENILNGSHHRFYFQLCRLMAVGCCSCMITTALVSKTVLLTKRLLEAILTKWDKGHHDGVCPVIPALYHGNLRHFYSQWVCHVCVLSPAAVQQRC